MAKGDTVTIVLAAGESTYTSSIVARKAGRTLKRKTRRSKTDGVWLDVYEYTRNGRPTGNALMVRLDAVLSVEEAFADEVDKVTKPRAVARPKITVDTLPMFAEIAEG